MPKDPHIDKWAFRLWQEPAILSSTFILALAITATIFISTWLTITLTILVFSIWIVILYFFRDPDREVIDKPGLVMAPCDGEVVAIENYNEEQYLKTDTIRVSTFLSLFSVHVQRAPLAGIVSLVQHKPGKFLQAFRPEASTQNEYIAMHLKTPFGQILVKQIAGILARRCINYAEEGDHLQTGQRFGHIKFGSRVDLFLPPGAEIKIKVGDKINGGITPIAQLPDQDHENN
jgi:phosphatidylserine decarboxylase